MACPATAVQGEVVYSRAGHSVDGHSDVQELSVESGAGEQCGSGIGPVLASEVAEGAAGFLDDGDQRGDVPRAGAQKEEGVQLTSRDQKSAVAGAGSGGRF